MSGVEVLGVVSSIIQIADLGAQVAVKLCAFCHKVKHAEQNLQTLSKDITLTCTVLRQLGDNLQQDDQVQLYSQNAFQTAQHILQECGRIFREIESAMDKDSAATAASAPAKSQNRFLRLSRKLNYVFNEPQLSLLQTNLDRLKNTMLLMLNLIIYAGQLRKRETENSKEEQREIIKVLVVQKRDSDLKFERLAKALEGIGLKEDSAERSSQISKDAVSNSGEEKMAGISSMPSIKSESRSLPRSTDLVHLAQHPAVTDDKYPLVTQEVIQYSALIENMLRIIAEAESVLSENRHRRIQQHVFEMHEQECQHFVHDHGSQAGELCATMCDGPLFKQRSQSSFVSTEQILIEQEDVRNKHGSESATRKPRSPLLLACLECRQRHLKCDGTQPICSRCTTSQLTCVYTPSRRGYKGSTRKSRRRDYPLPKELKAVAEFADKELFESYAEQSKYGGYSGVMENDSLNVDAYMMKWTTLTVNEIS